MVRLFSALLGLSLVCSRLSAQVIQGPFVPASPVAVGALSTEKVEFELQGLLETLPADAALIPQAIDGLSRIYDERQNLERSAAAGVLLRSMANGPADGLRALRDLRGDPVRFGYFLNRARVSVERCAAKVPLESHTLAALAAWRTPGADRDYPFLETPRLALYPVSTKERAYVEKIWTDPVLNRLQGGPEPRDEIPAVIERQEQRWERDGTGSVVAKLRATRQPVGILHLSREKDPESRKVGSIGFTIDHPWQGLGLAYEGAKALIEHGDFLGMERIIAYVNIRNAPSKRLLQELGFRFVRLAEWKGREGVVYDDVGLWERLPTPAAGSASKDR